MEQVTGRLENWLIDEVFGGVSTVIWGNIHDDVYKRWREGTRIHTSEVLTPKSEFKEGALIKTLNSTYLLGKEYVR